MKNVRILSASLLATVLIISCGGAKDQSTSTTETAIPVALKPIVFESFEINYHSIGRVVSENQTNLLFQSAGQIDSVWVQVGERVRKDQPLAKIKTDVSQTMYAQARSMYDKAKRDLESSKSLFESKVISSDQYEMARIGVDNARAAYTQARNSLDNAVLKAPFDGYIVAKNLNVGDLVSPGGAMQPPFILADMNRLKVIVPVPEARIGQIVPGQTARVSFKTFPDRKFEGTVIRIGMAPKDFSNNYDVEIRLRGNLSGLKLGLVADVYVVIEEYEDALVLPLNVIQDDGKEKFVFVEGEGRAQRKVVQVDGLAGSRVLVSADIKEGDRLIIKGYSDVNQGTLLDIVE
jgi:membrane fusion protein (multidrug efflux system)